MRPADIPADHDGHDALLAVIVSASLGRRGSQPSNAMEVIPVIDLMGGTVVRARMGRREQYRPIETPLSPTSDPVDMARGLLSLHPFASLYVADLDAIMGRGDNRAALVGLRAQFPQLTLWIDNGLCDLQGAEAWLGAGWGRLVLGSESQRDSALVRRFAEDTRVALSLDFRGPAFQGPPALLEESAYWPQKVIAMTLARVGSGAGPDLERLRSLREAASGRQIYAAGGVRDRADLLNLKRAGMAGALVASCLHDGRVSASDLAAL
jgi:phosphoribosylformimino-5-aminoimidazole carboxamide ribotide isomerase